MRVPASQSEAEPSKPQAATSEHSPSVRRLVAEHEVDVRQLQGTGKAGRVTKEDVNKILQTGAEHLNGERPEQRVPMSRLRAAYC